MANDDGGVQAAVDSAKKTLDNVAHSNVSAKQSPYAPKPSYTAARTARKESGASSTSLTDEAKSAAAGLAAKQKNVSDYAASN